MNKIEICHNVKKAIRSIVIDNGKKVLSAGTGVIIKEDGTLITAKHVIETEDAGIYHGKILVKGSEIEQLEYQPVIFNFGFDINSPELIKPINIDLTILKPVKKIEKAKFISLYQGIAEVGTDVIIAGFPDDVDLPFNFLDKLNSDNPEIKKAEQQINNRFKYFFRQLMFKNGMIGHSQKIKLNNFDVSKLGIDKLKTINVTGATYWIDNQLTYGGSGGPIVNSKGELLGIICQKAFTDAKMPNIKKLPSGTGMGLSHQLISWLIDYI